MSQGATVICESITENIDSAITAVINKELIEIQGDLYIKFNDEQVEYNKKFAFYMVSN